MYKVVSELVYFPNNVFVPRTTTLRSSSKLLYYQPFAHTNMPFTFLKLVLLGITYQITLLMLKLGP